MVGFADRSARFRIPHDLTRFFLFFLRIDNECPKRLSFWAFSRSIGGPILDSLLQNLLILSAGSGRITKSISILPYVIISNQFF